jgi:hypothetical protein
MGRKPKKRKEVRGLIPLYLEEETFTYIPFFRVFVDPSLEGLTSLHLESISQFAVMARMNLLGNLNIEDFYDDEDFYDETF